jgi:hemerythrin-like domain-containing protein
MQRTSAILIGMGLFMVVSCDQKGNTEQQKESVDRLENFVDSVETAVNREANHNWAVIDRRYNQLVNDVETSYANTRAEAREEWEDLEERYEEAKVEARKKAEKMVSPQIKLCLGWMVRG